MNRRLLAPFLALTCLLRTQLACGGEIAPLKVLDGTWLVERADSSSGSRLANAWNSLFIVKDGSFKATHYQGTTKDLVGTLTLVPGQPNAVDLNVEAVDLSEIWEGVTDPTCTLPAIYKFDAGRLVVCLQQGADRQRPTEFAARSENTTLLTLVRAGGGFSQFPKEIAVTVTDAAGHPVSGASVFSFMSWMPLGDDKDTQWHYSELGKTDGDGVANVKYEDLAFYPLAARDPEHKLIGLTATSPAGLQNGTATVVLQPESRMHGTLQSKELTEAGKPLQWTNVYLLYEGKRIASCASTSGTFEFFVPAGDYTLNAYGSVLRGRNVKVTVPAGQTDFPIPPIELTASRLVLLQGKPAPELEGVEGWRGEPANPTKLKGQFVLLDFWGYWCGPCVEQIPTLMKLNERFKDKGLTVICVHVDMDGDIDTVAKLDQKLATIRPKFWKGQDITFPVALTSGKTLDLPSGEHQRGGVAAQYGILSYPTTVLIDRDGKVVGQFAFSDEQNAVEQVEKLLAK